MIYCKELDKSFETKQSMFSALRKSFKDIIGLKKSLIQKSVEKDSSVKAKCLDASKINSNHPCKQDFEDDNYYYIVVNTTGILDSHRDLHVKGIWNKTSKERRFKNYLVDTHVLSLVTTLAKKEDVDMFVSEIPFSLLGKSYQGNTEALIYKIRKDKMNPLAKDFLDNDYAIEASVRMQYVIIEFAMNSILEEDKELKANFDRYISEISNKDEYEDANGEISYFWIVKEAKNTSESSLVLFGSNSTTGQIEPEPQNKNEIDQAAIKALEDKNKQAAKKALEDKQKYLLNLN